MIVPEGERGDLVVYLLHFDRKLGDRQHYIGSTIYDRRFKRWREHALGNSSHYVRKFIRAGVGFNVVRLWFCHDRDREKQLKSTSTFSRLCPLCTPTLPQPEPIHFDADGWAPTISAHWSNRKGAPP